MLIDNLLAHNMDTAAVIRNMAVAEWIEGERQYRMKQEALERIS